MQESRMAENVLFASDRPLYKDFVESAPDPICGFLPDTTITFANEAFCRAFEVERSEISGLLFFDLIPADEVPPVRKTIASLSPQHPSACCFTAAPLSDGVVHWKLQGVFVEGRLHEIRAFGREETESVKTSGLLSKSARRENCIAQIISDFAFCKNRSEFEVVVDNALALLGTEYRAERANLFRIVADMADETHEWCARGIPSQKRYLQRLRVEEGSWWVETARRSGVFHVAKPEDFPFHERKGRKELARLGVRSLAVFPVEAEGKLKGALSLENCPDGALSPETDFPLLASVSRVIGKTLSLLEAEEDLQAAKEMYQDIVETQTELIVRLAPDRTIIFCNLAYARFYGKTPEEIVGTKLERLSSSNFDHLSTLTPESPECMREKKVVAPDGRVCWHVWHDTAVFDGEGRLKEIQGVGWDMTELVAERRAHANERTRALALFENSPEGILVSLDGVRIHEANHAFCRMTGFLLDEVLGRPFEEVLSFCNCKRAVTLGGFLEKANTGEPAVEEGTLTTKNGKKLFFSLLALPVPEAMGNGKGLYLFFRDLTALKEKEAQLLANLEKLHNSFFQTVEVLAQTVESKDPYTAGHQRRTALLSLEIARRMGLDDEVCRGIYLAASIHDIGKIGIPSEILSRPGKLLDIEFALVKTHAEEGYKILKKVDFPWKIAEIVRQHHERLDGSGYPQGLKGDEILFEAKILAVADTVEAMSSHRPYRPSQGIDATLRFIEEEKGRFFDETVVDVCRDLFAEGGTFEELGAVADFLR